MRDHLLSLALVLALAGSAAAADENGKILRLGTLAPEDTPWADLLERLKKHVETATNGDVKVKLYLNGRQGDEPEMLQKIAAKKLDGGGFTASGLTALVPELSILELPFLFEDDAEADHVMDHVIRDEMARAFEAKGLHLFTWAVNGWDDFGSAGRPILSLEDIRASKPCTRESRVRRAFWAACGASAAVVPVPEVAGALAAGTIDLYETTPLFAAASQWFKHTRHWTDSNHIYQPAALLFDLAWWRALPEAQRKAIEAFAPELGAEARKAVRGLDASLQAGFTGSGIMIWPLAPKSREDLRRATAGIAPKLIEEKVFPRELHEKVEKALAAFREKREAEKDPVGAMLAKSDKLLLERPAREPLERAEAELLEAHRREPKRVDVLWRLARAQYFLGKYGPEEKRLGRYERGLEYAKKAVAEDARRVEAQYWLGVLYGLVGETRGISSSLFMVGDMQKALEKANELDASFDGGGPPRVLGRLFFKLPWVAGGSNAKALKFLREAMTKSTTMPFNYTYLAEVLIDEDEEDEAKKVLERFLAQPASREWPSEDREAREEARRMLKDLE